MRESVAFTASRETPFYGWFLGVLVIIVDRPEDVHTVLTSKSCIEKASIYKFFKRGIALFTAPGKKIHKLSQFVLFLQFLIRVLTYF